MTKPMKALLHYRAGPRLRERVASLASDSLAVVVVDEDDDDAFAREIANTDVLLHVLKPVTRTMIAGAPHLKLIQKIGVGVNTIDLAAARSAGIRVANMPGTNSQAVAEHALALILAVLRRVPFLDRVTRKGRGWVQSPNELEMVGEIAGRTVGLIGYGEVPRRLAPVLRAFGAEVIYFDKFRSDDPGFRPLDDLLREADIVSLHVPSTPETENMIDGAALATMKTGSIIINTARGDLIDESALYEALSQGSLLGAGLDVFQQEPADESPLFELANVVVTPHIAWLTPETIDRSLAVAIANVERIRSGETLLNEIA